MAFYVTGFYKDKEESGYYIFNSTNKQTVKVANKTLRNNVNIIKEIKNARLNKSAKGLDKQILKKKSAMSDLYPALVEEGKLLQDTKTIIYIDFKEGTYGTVNYNGTSIDWHRLEELLKITTGTILNNLAYNKQSGQLRLDSYHVIGKEKQYNIVIAGLSNGEAHCENEQNIEESRHTKNVEDQKVINENTMGSRVTVEDDIYISFDSVTSTPENVSGEDLSEQMELYTNSENAGQRLLSILTIKREETTAKDLKLSQREVYEALLMMLKDNDIITLPKWVISEFKFKLKYNLDTSMNLDKRVSLGTISLSTHSDRIIMAIVRFDDASEDVKLQIVMGYSHDETGDYSFETVRENFQKWRANKRYATV